MRETICVSSECMIKCYYDKEVLSPGGHIVVPPNQTRNEREHARATAEFETALLEYQVHAVGVPAARAAHMVVNDATISTNRHFVRDESRLVHRRLHAITAAIDMRIARTFSNAASTAQPAELTRERDALLDSLRDFFGSPYTHTHDPDDATVRETEREM
jgi:hypothetical protein